MEVGRGGGGGGGRCYRAIVMFVDYLRGQFT